MEQNYFSKLNAINVSDKTEKKNGLTYLSWAWAWGEVKKIFPDATYVIYENTLPNGYVVNYFTDGRTCWVKTGVIINGIEHIEELPVLNYSNKSISFEEVNSFDVNKTIQRSLTKAVARHGLGLYIYAGEDLPEEVGENLNFKQTKKVAEPKKQDSKQDNKQDSDKPITKEQLDKIVMFYYTLSDERQEKLKQFIKMTYHYADFKEMTESVADAFIKKFIDKE